MLKLVELEILRFELDVSLDLTLEFENLTVRYFVELATVIRPPHFRSLRSVPLTWRSESIFNFCFHICFRTPDAQLAKTTILIHVHRSNSPLLFGMATSRYRYSL